MTDAPAESVDWGLHQEWQWRGHRCHWRHLGDPRHPPLLLLHGFGTGSGHWRRNAGALAAAGWRVYGLDLLGFGASSQPALRLDNRLWARQVHGFLQEVVGEPAVLVGHSLGGLVALTCGVFYPRSVVALIAAPLPDPTLLMVSATEMGQGVARRPPWRRRLKRWGVVALCRLLPLEVLVPLLAHSPLLDLAIQTAYLRPVMGDWPLHRLIARPARQAGAVGSLRAMSIAMALRPQRATAPRLLNRLELPLLLIWGQRDLLVPLEVGWQCQRFRGELPMVVIEGAGHCPHDEEAEQFNATLIAWLERLSTPAAAGGRNGERSGERLP
ncbi:MAG: alpha/beta fold hydrolase [Cyanobacteriota bacterium]|nr:alpha/beta fold hydrolase [Cyanobacteriota bacterium]